MFPKNKQIIPFLISLILFSLVGCKDDVLPKPSAQLRLEFPTAKYATFQNDCPMEFDINLNSKIEADKNCGYSIHYPKMKATIYITYKTVNNDIDKLLRDAQKLTYEHVIKADDILEQPFVNRNNKVYGMFYQVGGNAATNAQFYATDSTKHFITGSVYFYAKPNFDSIMPAADFVKNDMRRLLESLRWK